MQSIVTTAVARRLIGFAAALACAGISVGASAASIEVKVQGVTGGKGKVLVAVCDKATFLKDCKYSASAPALQGETTVTVRDVPAGTWAVLSYQDANDNGKLDRNVLGIPKENYGFSRDARGRFGPPSFEDAAFVLQEEQIVSTVVLR